MSFSFGFYNSIERDRLYDAVQVSEIFDGLILDGVYATIGDAFIITASEEPNMVVIGSGRAWFNHTWNKNDTFLDVELEPPETILPRIDAVVIDVDERVSIRTNDILVVKGTPSSNPQNPTLINEAEHHQYPLAYILRDADTPVISQAKITNAVGTSDCPFVTAVLEGLDIDALILQWRAGWAEFLAACQARFDSWEDDVKNNAEGLMSEFRLQLNEYRSELEIWETTQKEDFKKFYNEFKTGTVIYEEEWIQFVDHLKNILEEDALGNLILEMEKVKDDVEAQIENTRDYLDEMISGFQAKVTHFNDDGSIVATAPDGSNITTVFKENGDIEETLRSKAGVVGAVKLTEFKENGDIVESVVGGNYPEFVLSKNTGVGEYINNTYELGNDAFNKLQSIRDVANSTVMMTAIVNNAAAWEGLSKSPTAMTAFLASDVALAVFATKDDILETLLQQDWDGTVQKPVLVTGIVNSRAVLKFIFDDTTMKEKFMDEVRLLNALRESTLKDWYVVSAADQAPFELTNGVSLTDSEVTLGSYTYGIGLELVSQAGFNDSEDASHRYVTTIYPEGETGEKYKYIHDTNEHITIQNMVIDISEALSYVTVTPADLPTAGDVMSIVAF